MSVLGLHQVDPTDVEKLIYFASGDSVYTPVENCLGEIIFV